MTMAIIILGLVMNSGSVNAANAQKQTLKLPVAVKNVAERTEVDERYDYQIQLLQNQSLENFKKQVVVSNDTIQKNQSVEDNLAKAGYKSQFANLYKKASEKYGVPWQVIAAVHVVETHQSGNTTVASYAGAMGPMQFMPGTFRAYGQDGDGDGTTNIHNVNDAVFAAANYLKANGAANGNVTNALFRYNHSMEYVNHVQGIAHKLGY
ncbi:hypothetical protein A2Y26_03805 [candidate division CPR2 bacterium GWD2_39_7]|nr:MAG: hypothetical protein A2Y27_00930 [candidate division CPR2 bacterium GWD1_39_7]OGB71721.1 MAG: hypothetical protein A2Y26_03805 [candidate division CPR2 bacterium GWD2_39_7]